MGWSFFCWFALIAVAIRCQAYVFSKTCLFCQMSFYFWQLNQFACIRFNYYFHKHLVYTFYV